MKKILLGMGTMAAIIAPITSVVACGDEAKRLTDEEILNTPVDKLSKSDLARLLILANKDLDSRKFGNKGSVKILWVDSLSKEHTSILTQQELLGKVTEEVLQTIDDQISFMKNALRLTFLRDHSRFPNFKSLISWTKVGSNKEIQF